jgi:putative (di)nucleoside polyphosphate hydrolase
MAGQALPYRKCAGAAVFNRDGMFLVGERAGKQRGQWQFPQGGFDNPGEPAETALQAAEREMYEEIGLKTPDTIREQGSHQQKAYI